jgi:phosphoglycolate phosphatase
MNVKCVIYDCDGVLFDSLEANKTLYNHIAVSCGRSPLTMEELHFCHISTVKESIRHLFRGDPDGEISGFRFLANHIDLGDYVPFLVMEPNLLETLAELRSRGILTAINTNRTTSMPHLMKRFDLSRYFDMVVTALDVAHPKPDPESMLMILDGLKVRPDEVVYVGDSIVDQKAAESSKVAFVAYKNDGLSKNGMVIHDHREILKIIKGAIN